MEHAPDRTSHKGLHKAVFLDRDGTVNVEKNYLIDPCEFVFIPGVPEAIYQLKQAGYLVVLVTNQSGIARGYFTHSQVAHLHQHLQTELKKHHTAIDAFYLCPHHPTAGDGVFTCACSCRKGEPGMLLQAAAELDIDLGSSYMVGDKLADLKAGLSVGCHPVLVQTGYGDQTLQQAQVAAWNERGSIDVCVDLVAAARLILARG
ncbi:MAG: D-glycero-beta-D-manno-heptose 1,7-bisphosphate 7-phosphatase [Desulfuromonadaceae bacterium]|nr:D-glycero-beta-D-manno-heptose 1,7-bisphosphate 7-phosphatase [Desulfuromonas sp.]MDY0185030.1 D-glycero-beta-D-manno-heptose 1,7-bisphosphate 7-phosphatase [Desulfuromonadaceae bacterium]